MECEWKHYGLTGLCTQPLQHDVRREDASVTSSIYTTALDFHTPSLNQRSLCVLLCTLAFMKKKMEFHFPYIKNTKLNFRTNLTLVTPQLMSSGYEFVSDASCDFQQVTTCLYPLLSSFASKRIMFLKIAHTEKFESFVGKVPYCLQDIITIWNRRKTPSTC